MNARASCSALLLIAAVAAGTAFTLQYSREKDSATPSAIPANAANLARSQSRHDAASTPPAAHASTRSTAASVTTVAELSPDSAAALAEQVTLRQLAHDTDLELSDAHWSELAAIVARHQAIRHAHEASIATVITLPDGRRQVDVPSYGDVGELLRAQLFDELSRRLGADTADQIDTHLGSALEGYFAGFGVSAQALVFENAPTAAGRLVTRTIAYSSAGDGDRLRTRREIHLTAAEDPSGARWAPFVDLLAQGRS